MSGQSITEILNLINQQDWDSLNKQVTGPYMKQLVSIISESFPNGVLSDGKTIQQAITLLQQGANGGGGNTFDPDYFKVAEGLVTFIAKYISLAPRTAVNVPGLTMSAIAPQQVSLADGVYTLSLSEDLQAEELDIRFANGVIMPTGNRAKVSFDVKCENISQLSDFKFGLFLKEGSNIWTYYDEDTIPSTDYQSVTFIVDGDKANDYTEFRLVLRSKTGAKVFLSNAKVYFDNVRFEYWPIGEAAGGLQLPVADLLLKTAGVVPEVPPAGKVPGDDGYDINLHLMPGQWAINTVDNLIFYNRDGVIQQFRAANNTDDLPLADPTKHSLLPTDVTLSDSLDTTRKAIIALRDTLREIIGAHAAIVAAPVPQAVGVANQQYTFDQDLPSSNEDVMVIDAGLNLIYLYLAARYSYTTFGVVENTSSADRTLYFRIVDNDTNALLNPERSVDIPKNSIIDLDWTVTTIEITEAKNVRLELRASGTGVSILALETEISTAGGSVSGNPNDKGFFATEAALRAAHPTGQDGWYALIGETDTFWVWDSDTPDWVNTGSNTTPITVDSALDANSTNPVENKAVTNRPLSTIKPDAGNANKIPVVSTDGLLIGYTAFTFDQIVQLAQVDMSDVNVGEKKILLAEKLADGSPSFTGAIAQLDKLGPPSLDALLDETNAAWDGDEITLTGDNLSGALGENSQEYRIGSDFFLCISHSYGTDATNGSATWVRNRGQDSLTPGITHDDAIIAELETEAGWSGADFKQITSKSKKGSWYRAAAGGYHYLCIDKNNGWTRVGFPSTTDIEITTASHPTLTTNLAAHDFAVNGMYLESSDANNEAASQAQEWWDTTNNSWYKRNMNGYWAKMN